MKVRSRRRPRSRRIKFGSIQTQKNEKKAQKHFRIPLKTRKPLRGTGIDFWPRQVQLSEEKKTKISGKKKQLKTHTRTQPNDERQRMSEKKWGKKGKRDVENDVIVDGTGRSALSAPAIDSVSFGRTPNDKTKTDNARRQQHPQKPVKKTGEPPSSRLDRKKNL